MLLNCPWCRPYWLAFAASFDQMSRRRNQTKREIMLRSVHTPPQSGRRLFVLYFTFSNVAFWYGNSDTVNKSRRFRSKNIRAVVPAWCERAHWAHNQNHCCCCRILEIDFWLARTVRAVIKWIIRWERPQPRCFHKHNSFDKPIRQQSALTGPINNFVVCAWLNQ